MRDLDLAPHRGGRPPKPVTVLGVYFPSYSACARALGTSTQAVQYYAERGGEKNRANFEHLMRAYLEREGERK